MSDTKSVVDMLMRHYLPEGRPAAGYLVFEVGSPCGKRRADAMWAPMTSNSGGLVGHEIKVSRADLMSELADPAKADPWLRYCERWWLTVSDPNLVTGLDIPEAWGIMAPPSGRRTRSMTILREAPKLKPTNPAPAYERLLSVCFHRSDDKLREATNRTYRNEAEIERLRRQVQELHATGGASHPEAKRVAQLLAEVEQIRRDGWEWGSLDMAIVRDAILDAQAVKDVAEEARATARRMTEDLRRATGPLDRVIEQLDRLDSGEPRRKRGAA